MYHLTIDNKHELRCDTVAYSSWDAILFFSGFGYSSHMADISHSLSLSHKSMILNSRGWCTSRRNEYEIVTAKMSGSDYTHMIGYKKDYVEKNERTGTEIIHCYIYRMDNQKIDLYSGAAYPESFLKSFYEKLSALSPLPIIKDWMNYLVEKLAGSGCIYDIESNTISSDEKKLYITTFAIRVDALRRYITEGLQEGKIKISENGNNVSGTMSDITGLDSYLSAFRDTLAHKIQESFVPRFIPGKDDYSETLKNLVDYDIYRGKLHPFEAQKGVIQAASNALDHKKAAFVIGEQGVGKTLTAILTVCTHNRDNKYMTNIVMCPGHLVEKWKREIERLAPLSKAVIISDFDQMVSMIPEIKNRCRRYHLWLVISKETAKFGYTERPQAVWSKSAGEKVGEPEGVYCCPECGQPLYTVTYEGRGRYRHKIKHYFKADAFSKQTADNIRCMNTVKRWDPEKRTYKDVPCNAKLWGAFTKPRKTEDGEYVDSVKWLNYGNKVGWLERDKVSSEFDRLMAVDKPKKEEAQKIPALSEALNGNVPAQHAPVKYPLGHYIRRFLKGYIDYALCDEIQQLKGGTSLQGRAFGDLVTTAKHALCFTGTLLNGYASGIFYILYRCFPALMKKEGFEYGAAGETEFMKQYGVYKETSKFSFRNGRQGNHIGASKQKELPGVSPLVFTKFLLENAAFISLSDIGEGLPAYEEIPIGIDMDSELGSSYHNLENAIHNEMRSQAYSGKTLKTLSQMVQLLSIYPDQPYHQPPVVHPDTGEIVVTPPDLNEDTVREKERTFIDLVKQKVQEENQKVLVYYTWTGRTNLGRRLPRLLEAEGIKAAVMNASVKSRDREEWIRQKVEKDNIDVLICNPALVETGLDLLDFTTIIFYQVGYNLFTLRQASRRSWRLSQTKDVKVYFLYYKQTVQEQALSLMATKLQAAMAIEGKFSEEGLNAMSNNEDLLTQIASSVAKGIQNTVDAEVFSQGKISSTKVKAEDFSRLIDIPKENKVTMLDKYREENRTSHNTALHAVTGNLDSLLSAI